IHRTPAAVDEEHVAAAAYVHFGAVAGVILSMKVIEVGGRDGRELIGGDVVDHRDVQLEVSGSLRGIVAECIARRDHTWHRAQLPGQIVYLGLAIGWRCGTARGRDQRHEKQKADATALTHAHQPILPMHEYPVNPGNSPVLHRWVPG